MQKLLTITINIEKLQEASRGAFTITEVEEVNTLLDEGWVIEQWEFITGEKEAEKAVILLVLNDEMGDAEFDAAYIESDFDEDLNDNGVADESGEDEEDADVHPNMR